MENNDIYNSLTDYPARNTSREDKILFLLNSLCNILVRNNIISNDDIQSIICEIYNLD